MDKIKIRSNSEGDTLNLGKKIGEIITESQIILLTGELGSGKTLFVKGLVLGLDSQDDVTSPTFKLVNEYQGRLDIYHMDLYRLDREQELYDIGFEEYLDRKAVVVIEWPEIGLELIPDNYLQISFQRIDENSRLLEISAYGDQGKDIRERLAEDVNTGD